MRKNSILHIFKNENYKYNSTILNYIKKYIINNSKFKMKGILNSAKLLKIA